LRNAQPENLALWRTKPENGVAGRGISPDKNAKCVNFAQADSGMERTGQSMTEPVEQIAANNWQPITVGENTRFGDLTD
jgi:hypothetical protein